MIQDCSMMKGWKEYTFDDFVECNPKVEIKRGELVETCEMEDIDPFFKFLYSKGEKIYNGSNSKFQNGDTVFARITPCLENGKIAQIKGLTINKAIGSTEFFVFRGKKEVSTSEFVFYLCKTNLIRETAINSMTGASGRQRADLKALKKLKLYCPDNIDLQSKIASVLAAYDDLIEVNKQQIALLEEEARELYKEWFVRMRFPGHQSVRFVNGIPEGWEYCKINDVFEIMGGGTPNTEKLDYWENGEINWFSPTDLTGDLKILYSQSSKKITEKGLKHSSAKLFPAYSIMMTSRATIGALGINTLPSTTNQGFIVCIPNEKVPLYYLYYYLYFGREYFTMYASGSTFLEITKGTFKKLDILVPLNNIVLQYNESVTSIFEKIEYLQSQNQHLSEIRDHLLPRLMSGRLSVKE